MKTIMYLLGMAAMGLTAPAPANSQAPGGDFSEISELSLLEGWMRGDGLYLAAVRVDLKPGWKTYWRTPGDSGIAPIFDWSASHNLAQIGYIWPSPQIIDYAGTRTIGYQDQLVLPVLMRPEDPALPVTARLSLDYGVCDDICVPAKSQAEAVFSMEGKQNQRLIRGAMEKRTQPAATQGFTSATCRLTPNGQDFVFAATLDFDGRPRAPEAVVIETGSELVWISAPDHSIEGREMNIEADLQYFGDGTMTLDRNAVRITLLEDGASIEVRGCKGR